MAQEQEQEPPELGQLRDSSGLWRASLWGGAATVALAAAILMTADRCRRRSGCKWSCSPNRRSSRSRRPILCPRIDADALKRETTRLEAQVRDLAADREKLNARIASLETQSLGHDRLDQTRAGGRRRQTSRPAAVVSAPAVSAPVTPPPQRCADRASGETEPAPAAAAAAPSAEPVPLPPTRIADRITGRTGHAKRQAKSASISAARAASTSCRRAGPR